MSERWVGVLVAGEKVILVDAEVGKSGPITVHSDQSWKLQSGDRACAYNVMHQQVADYLRENAVDKVVVKASALTTGSMKKAHLDAAELRGVVIAAAAAVAKVEVLAKAHISRTFGDRKVDEYVADGAFWAAQVTGNLRSGSREAAMVLLAARGAA